MFSGVNLDKFLQRRYKSIWLMKLTQVKGKENPKKIPATGSKFLTLSYHVLGCQCAVRPRLLCEPCGMAQEDRLTAHAFMVHPSKQDGCEVVKTFRKRLLGNLAVLGYCSQQYSLLTICHEYAEN